MEKKKKKFFFESLLWKNKTKQSKKHDALAYNLFLFVFYVTLCY